MILSVINIIRQDDHVTVTAVVEDIYMCRQHTLDEPIQYLASICQASFELDPTEQIPVDEDRLCIWLDDLDLQWYDIRESDDTDPYS